VRDAAGERDDFPGTGGEPAHRAHAVADVEDELALEHVIHLTRIVAVHHGRPSPGRHAHLHGEQRAAGLCAGGEHGELVAPEADALRRGNHGRTIDR
jgi:uncharacterized protein YbjT (DUF2867 family)